MRYQELFEWSTDVLASVNNKPGFQVWFGESKVVDRDGLPLPVFHYTSAQFEVSNFHPFSHFGSDKAAMAIWQHRYDLGDKPGRIRQKTLNRITQNPDAFYWKNDGRHGRDDVQHRTIPVFLRIEKPLRIEDHGDAHRPEVFLHILRDLGLYEPDFDELHRLAKKRRLPDNFGTGLSRLLHVYSDEKMNSIILDVMRNAGYDGFVYKNLKEHKGSRSWIILDPYQVRSVFEFLG